MGFEILELNSIYLLKLKSCINSYFCEEKARQKHLFEIIKNSDGAYPIDVVYVLDNSKIPYVEGEKAFKIGGAKNKFFSKRGMKDNIFSDPHPLDYDWRFSSSTASFLVNKIIADLDKRNSRVALFGAKTLFPLFIEKKVSTTLYIKSASLLDNLREAGYNEGLVEADLFYPLDNTYKNFSAVVADPPWYNEYYKAFLARSIEILHLGGTLYLSVLPSLSRPSAQDDRMIVLNIASSLGFSLIDELKGVLYYQTPVFEHNALIAQGLFCEDWRRGDLWVLRKTSEVHLNSSSVLFEESEQWVEFIFHKKKIKIREKEQASNDKFDFYPADPKGQTFSYVSRRSPIRSKIDLWTSDNIALRVNKLSVLRPYLETLERMQSLEDMQLLIEKDNSLSEYEKERLLILFKIIVKGQ